jgi:peptidoglycan/xylan/chitin deacetylase (PgdA/CDA1 family)
MPLVAVWQRWLRRDPAWWTHGTGRLVDAGLRAAATAIAPAARWLAPRHGVALVYHRLGAERGDPRRELLPAISLTDFEAQLRHVAARYRAVPASALPAACAAHRRGARLPLAITFDDDHAGHLRHAAPALRRHGLPATFFVCGASLDGPHAFWWERLQRVADAGGRPADALPGLPTDLHAAAEAFEEMRPEDRDRAAEALLAAAGPDPEDAGLRRAAVAALGRDFEVGFHTLRHHPLNTLGDAQLERAFREGRDAVAVAAGAEPAAVAYPSGRFDGRTGPAAAAAGFGAGYTTSGEPLRPGGDPHLIGRFEPRSPSLGVFMLKLAVAPWRRADQR